MEPGIIDRFKNEQLLGNRAQHSYDEFIKGFIEEKRESLFMAFQDISIGDNDDLLEVKRMLYTLNRLERDILNIIDTGLLASESLKSEGDIH